MKWPRFCGILLGLAPLIQAVSAIANPPDRVTTGPMVVRDDGVRIVVTSSSTPSWQAIVDRRKGGIISELTIPSSSDDNLVSTDGGRFEGLCNLVYVDFEHTGKPEGYVAKGTYAYHGTARAVDILQQSPERVDVRVSGTSGNQTKPRADVLSYQQTYEFRPDRIVCSGQLQWLFQQVVPGSKPELLQLNSKFARDAVEGELRVWDKDTGPLALPETNSKGLNYPAEIHYPLTVEVPLKGGYAVRFHDLELPEAFRQARFYWNEYPRQIEGRRGFAFKAWEGWPGNDGVHFSAEKPISYRYEIQITTPLPPASPVISKLTWAPVASVTRQAPGSDNWPMTWGDDGLLYTAYGDGNGFEPFVEKKLSLGLVRISGGPSDFRAENLRSAEIEQLGHGAAGKKASGLVMVDGVLYMWVRNAGNSTLVFSRDRGKTWEWSNWKWTQSFGCPTFLNFGPNYSGARDDYVYVYSSDSDSAYLAADRMVLARVPKTKIVDQNSYEFFVDRDAGGIARWSSDINQRGAVFSHPGKCYRSGITFNAGLKRYLWCQIHPQSTDSRGPRFQGGFGVYDAPEPWGPWTTVYYTDDWDIGPGDTSSFPTKWMSAGGRTMSLVFSGDDAFSVRQAELTLVDQVSNTVGQTQK